jgi:hypothetical protein
MALTLYGSLKTEEVIGDEMRSFGAKGRRTYF